MRRSDNSDARALWDRIEERIEDAESRGHEEEAEKLRAQLADLQQHGGYIPDVDLSPYLVRPKRFFDLVEMANFSTEWLLIEYFRVRDRREMDRYLAIFGILKDEQQRFVADKHREARDSAKKARANK